MFGENLHHLLMQPPVKDQVVLGLDPGYRNGCKIAVVDGTGRVLDTTVVYPTQPYNRVEESKKKLAALIKKHRVTVVSIGNGTASRESEQLVAELIRELGPDHRPAVSYMVVSEAGASVYSASKLASEEFPQFDVNLRSAVSIARRLQDPLAELVKIDPKAIGIGQYQHDMPPARLESALGGVVESCVNSVGVDLNTASGPLLGHVAGINSAIAKNIVAYREENGGFTARSQLLKVPKLGKKTYEQCAGFLRIPGAKNPLDATAVHPESYTAAKALLEECGWKLADVGTAAIRELPAQAEGKGIGTLARQLGVGEPTIRDIIDELLKPGRDPRDTLPPPLLRTDVMELKDLKPEMILTGTVRNVIDFGAFVDIGVHEDGLVHVSQLADRFVKHPSQVVKVGDTVTVTVKDVDMENKKVSLIYKKSEDNPWEVIKTQHQVGDVVTVRIMSITAFGAFAQIIPGIDGLIHISQIARERVEKVADKLSVGDVVEAKITELDYDKKRASLSIKALLAERDAADEAANYAPAEDAADVVEK